ncbi:putative permease [Alicyclobacillus hesperidum URH17-3-68]|nr:putative permease [Alicyclobacillus hesperidum URH17-3-68]
MLSLLYALGHELVIVVFGGAAVLVGWTLPHWIDGGWRDLSVSPSFMY